MRLLCLVMFLLVQTQLHSASTTAQMLVLALKTQVIESGSVSSRLPFHHNITLTMSLVAGTPPQNVTMVVDTGSELSCLRCNTSRFSQPAFDPSGSSSYSLVNCSSPTCTTRTQDFSIPTSCDSSNLCHAVLPYADASSSEGNLASDTFYIGGSELKGTVFGCMDSGFSSNPDEDSKTTGLMVLGDSNLTWLAPLNYTPLIQMSTRLPYFDCVAYTVQLEWIKVSDKLLPLAKSILEPDHTGAGQTMADSGAQFTFLLGPAYSSLRSEFLNQTNGLLQVFDDPNYVFQGAMDLCYLVPPGQARLTGLPTVNLVFGGAEINVPGDRVLYRVPGEVRGNDWIYCFTFGNSDLLMIEAYVIGHYHQQNQWMEFNLEKSRIGLAPVRCDLAGQRFSVPYQ